jgi:hypothetical protein
MEAQAQTLQSQGQTVASIATVKELQLFNAPVVNWVRGWPAISFEPEFSKEGNQIADIIHAGCYAKRVPVEVVKELVKIAYATGLVAGSDGHRIGYDGSCIAQIAPECAGRNGDGIFLADLDRLRSQKPASVPELVTQSVKFFQRNGDLFSGFSGCNGDFSKKFKYGVFRMESLYSIPPGFREMGLEDFFRFVAINLWERKELFGENFVEVHRSSTIPKDDDPERCLFETFGHWEQLEGVLDTQQWGKVPLFCRIAPSYGECCLGWELAITVTDPRSNLFTVGVNMVWDSVRHQFVPIINKIQTMVLHLDKCLRYWGQEMLSDDELLSRKLFLELQGEINKFLGGDLFYTMIAAIVSFYRLREYPAIKGICGRDNLWLKYHAKEVLAKKGVAAAEQVRKRSEEIYDKKFAHLGFARTHGCWELPQESYAKFLRRALVPYQLAQNEIIRVEVERGGRIQPKNISLPTYAEKTTPNGLGAVLKVMDNCFCSVPLEIGSFQGIGEVLQERRNERSRIKKEREALLIG